MVKEIKEMLELEGKAELMDFAEDLVEVGYKAIKIVIKHTDTKIDDLILAPLDGTIQKYIDGIDKKEG